METPPIAHVLSALALALAAGACGGKDATELGAAGAGGSASGVSGSAGAAGSSLVGAAGSADAGGAGGSGGDAADAGTPRLRAVLENGKVKLISLDPAWFLRCDQNPTLMQKVGDTWAPVRDERPTTDPFRYFFSAHYLDGILHQECGASLGCDYTTCSLISQNVGAWDEFVSFNVPALEYVQVGERPAPICGVYDTDPYADAGSAQDAGGDAGGRLVPNIESHALTGALGVRVRYYRDQHCQTEATTADVTVE